MHVINLATRPDRWETIRKHLDSLSLCAYRRFNAIRPSWHAACHWPLVDFTKFWMFRGLDRPNERPYCIGATGCKMSHYALLRSIHAQNDDSRYHIVLEDDALLVDRAHVVAGVSSALAYLESNNINFNILYLGCNLHSTDAFEIVTDGLLKCAIGHGHMTHAMLFKSSSIPTVLRAIEQSVAEIDNVYAAMDDRYCVFPMLASQRESVSDIGAWKEVGRPATMGYGDLNKQFIRDRLMNQGSERGNV